MNVDAAFLGFYCDALRVILPCLSGDETKAFLALALHKDAQGKEFPGVRVLSDLTGFPPIEVSGLLNRLEARGYVMCIRQAQRDPLTGQIVPDVWIVNPEIVVVSDPVLWNEFRLRHACMPESGFPLKSAQAESESIKQSKLSRVSEAESQPSDGAASLFPDYANQSRPAFASAARSPAVTNHTAGSANAPNSAQQGRIPPRSAAPPLRQLTFQESIHVNAIRQHVADMSAKTAIELVSIYGVEWVNKAVLRCEECDRKSPIAKKTGWIKTYLKSTIGART